MEPSLKFFRYKKDKKNQINLITEYVGTLIKSEIIKSKSFNKNSGKFNIH